MISSFVWRCLKLEELWRVILGYQFECDILWPRDAEMQERPLGNNHAAPRNRNTAIHQKEIMKHPRIRWTTQNMILEDNFFFLLDIAFCKVPDVFFRLRMCNSKIPWAIMGHWILSKLLGFWYGNCLILDDFGVPPLQDFSINYYIHISIWVILGSTAVIRTCLDSRSQLSQGTAWAVSNIPNGPNYVDMPY